EEKLLKKMKTDNNFSQNQEEINAIFEALIRSKKGELIQQEIAQKSLFVHGGKAAKVGSFLQVLPDENISYSKDQLIEFYKKFEKEFIISFEDSIAPMKYPNYGFLMQEYEEGLLLFEVMQRVVWEKASEDSVGLERYYKNHLEDYYIGERINCLLVNSFKDDLLSKVVNIQIPIDSLSDAEKILSERLGKDKLNELKIAKTSLLVSEFPNFESIKMSQGNWIQTANGQSQCLHLGYLKEGPQDFDEIKGLVMADYQAALDIAWIKELRSSAKIKIYNKELKALTKN
ncbi:MAG TPA: hypothetical protein VIN11_04290, partial [Roseivirga sp.]